MAIDNALPHRPRRPLRVLAGLFDDAWEHGRKRRLRATTLALLLVAVGVVIIATTTGAPRRSMVTASNRVAAARYQVCVSNDYGLWRYVYEANCAATGAHSRVPHGAYSYSNLVVPAGARVDLTIARSEVPHSFRIRTLGLTIRALPHSATRISFRAPRTRETYLAQCLSGCPREQAPFASYLVVMPPARYKAWLATQTAAIAHQNRQASMLRAALVRQGVLASNASQ